LFNDETFDVQKEAEIQRKRIKRDQDNAKTRDEFEELQK